MGISHVPNSVVINTVVGALALILSFELGLSKSLLLEIDDSLWLTLERRRSLASVVKHSLSI